MDVSFPHLGIYIKHLVNHFNIFGFRIAFYGIIIALGMLAGINLACADAKRRGQNPEVYLDFAMYAIIFSIIVLIISKTKTITIIINIIDNSI